jgi:acetyl-CoA decarbonylase/synthase complex subunit delta
VNPPVEKYRGRVRSVDLGGLFAGGGAAFPLHHFDGELPNPARIFFEVWDVAAEEWSPELADVYGEKLADAVAWARDVASFGADGLYLRLKSADPHGAAGDVHQVARAARGVVEAAGLPAIVVGCGDPDTDRRLMPLVAKELEGLRAVLGNAENDTYRDIGGAAREHGHVVLAYTPMDVSLAKQLNVLLAQAGTGESDIVMDPTCSALGYSFEYAYTVFERDRLAALAQNDAKMQVPLLANVGQETWHVKESRASGEEWPGHGDRRTRGVLWESVTALCLVLAGADIVVIRHPETARLLREALSALSERTDAWR